MCFVKELTNSIWHMFLTWITYVLTLVSLSCFGLHLVPSSLACHVYFMLCSIFLSFVWASFSYLSCTPHASLPLFISYFLSHIPLDSFVYSWQKGREYTREYTEVYRHLYMTHVRKHLYLWLWGRNSTSCTFVERESHRRDVYTMGEETFFMREPCFALFFFTIVFTLLYGALSYV